MNNLVTIPLAISFIIVLVVYLMKKDEPDPNKRPNYPIVFVVALILSGIGIYAFGSNEDSVNVVMKEIYTGEPNF